MKRFSALILLLIVGCASVPKEEPLPTTNEEWGIRCVGIVEDPYDKKPERLQACLDEWDAWAGYRR